LICSIKHITKMVHLVLFVRDRIMVNNDKCDILTGLWLQV